MSGLTIHLTPEASRALTRLTLALRREAARAALNTLTDPIANADITHRIVVVQKLKAALAAEEELPK
jgi:hypothetical protein